MILSMASYLAGGVIGFAITLAVMQDVLQLDLYALTSWVSVNLGHSTWAFTACLILYLASMGRLRYQLEHRPVYHNVVQLDQLTDVWTHLFVGIGVIWTAIGMRSALVNTLAVPESLVSDAGQVLNRLVDGGILLALSTTIVGAIGGYLMRLFKSVSLGSELTEYYHHQDRSDIEVAIDRLKRIEQLLESNAHASTER